VRSGTTRPRRCPKAADPAVIAREIETVARLGARHVLLGEPDYPALLAELDTAPPALIIRGDIGLAQRGGVALVG
jgi:DNA processing protein